jgi:stage II sporulation protein D
MKLPLRIAGPVLLIVACTTATTIPTAPQRPTATPDRGGLFAAAVTSPRQIAPPRIRVGLMSDQGTYTFGRIEGGYVVETPDGARLLRRGFTVQAPLENAVTRHTVQIASLSDRTSAENFAAKIGAEHGVPGTTLFDARGGVYRVMVGDFATSEEATLFRQRLIDAGLESGIFVTRRPSAETFERAVVITDDEGNSQRLVADSILVAPASADVFITIDGQPYRGGARLFINSRGLLNVINDVNLEDYVRGVVPNEMGPASFDRLEALKAQALAARTYAISRLNDFANEGYDICPTPACQVYKGQSTEHALSDRAVRETAGMILTHQGKPIDALYSSTCGGETSDVSTMFTGRNEPYLRGVRCVELETFDISGVRTGPLVAEWQVDARIAEAMLGADAAPTGAWDARAVARIVNGAARLMRQQIPEATPRSARRRDVLEYLGTVWRLDEAAVALTLPEDRRYWFPSSNHDDPAYRAAAFMIRFRLTPTQSVDRVDLAAAMPREELLGLVGSWMRRLTGVREFRGRVAAFDGSTLSVDSEGTTTRYSLPRGIPLFREISGRYQELDRVTGMVGDRLVLYSRPGGGVVGLVVQGNFDGAAFDRSSSFASWTRSYRADELVKTISRRNPISELVDLRPRTIDRAHRVATLDVIAEGGRTVTLRGIVIRWSLNLPDNLFVMQRSVDADGMPRFTFFGKGWGHGTGMCQVGAYGMAYRGRTVEQIVKHYYTGVEITRYAP